MGNQWKITKTRVECLMQEKTMKLFKNQRKIFKAGFEL